MYVYWENGLMCYSLRHPAVLLRAEQWEDVTNYYKKWFREHTDRLTFKPLCTALISGDLDYPEEVWWDVFNLCKRIQHEHPEYFQ